MKKRLSAVFSVFLALCLLSSSAVFAESAPSPEQEQVVDVDDAGKAAFSGSFTLTDDGDTVLEVTRVKAPGLTAALGDGTANGYYTAEFMIPETNYNVFLTGLTQDNADEIRQAIVNSYAEGEDFNLSNLGFIDAEKTWANDGDENLCWAATTSNLLSYTGWAAQAGFHSTDDLFEAFIDAFGDDSGNVYYGAGWFFDGLTTVDGAQPAKGTGRYLPKYCFTDLVKTFSLYEDCMTNLPTVYNRLRDGHGIGLNVDIYGSAGYESSHAISCWGFVTDIRYPVNNKLRYKSIFVTDSDSDKYSVQDGVGRRDADDVMSLYALESVEQEGIDTYMFQITPAQKAIFSEATVLAPYHADIPYETDPGASMDLSADYDILIDPFYLTAEENKAETVTVFSPDDTIYYQARMFNNSELTFPGSYRMVVTVKDAQGAEKYTRQFNYDRYHLPPGYSLGFGYNAVGKLPAGDYTITAEFNPNRSVKEAYYFNNTGTVRFKVREKYLTGDADNDGSVSSIDATLIQRILARLNTDADGHVNQRGDVNESGELDLLDVTVLQRYLAQMTVFYPVNTSRFYD